MNIDMYGVLLPKTSAAMPDIVGPIVHPIPKIVSYAPTEMPIIFPDTCFVIKLNVMGKYRLNAKPNNMSEREKELKVVNKYAISMANAIA